MKAGAYPGVRLENRLAVERIESDGDSLRRIFPDTAFDVGLALLCFGSGREAIGWAEGHQGPLFANSTLRQCKSSHRVDIDLNRCLCCRRHLSSSPVSVSFAVIVNRTITVLHVSSIRQHELNWNRAKRARKPDLLNEFTVENFLEILKSRTNPAQGVSDLEILFPCIGMVIATNRS